MKLFSLYVNFGPFLNVSLIDDLIIPPHVGLKGLWLEALLEFHPYDVLGGFLIWLYSRPN